MKKGFKRSVALLLALAMILPVQRLEVVAEIVSKNEVTEKEKLFLEADVTGKEISYAGASGERIPADPVHHCALDYTDFSYVYFGSYPQSEVTDGATIAAIEDTISISGTVTDVGMDVWVDGIKYRRISKNDADNNKYFGDNDFRYFKWEKIKWKVLQNDGNSLFAVADRALDCKDYYDDEVDITWEDSTIRDWLNGSFYNIAFNNDEQEAVMEQNIVNEDNPEYGTDGGKNTKDKVYLLSINEVTKEDYGFCSNSETQSLSRRVKISDYANAKHTCKDYDDNCKWWLRSPGSRSNSAAYVYSYGWVDQDGFDIDYSPDKAGICPALHINLQSDTWSMLDSGGISENDVRTEGGIPVNPIHYCPERMGITDDTEWCYIYFGSYPQTEVMGSNLTSDIQNASYDKNGDATVDGIRYRRISRNDTNHDGYFGNNNYRYFKWEKIKWKIIQNNGNTLFVVADRALDCKDYHNESVNITWEDSTIRNWLNGSFYSTAFNSDEQKAVVEQVVVNEDNPKYGIKGGNDTKDKVYLLSIDEVTKDTYGFCNDSVTLSLSRRIKASDYASARGTFKDDGNNCWWWLRSPVGIGYGAVGVSVTQHGTWQGCGVTISSGGVCPALHINLSSDFWSIEDDAIEKEETLLTSLQASKKKTIYEQGETLNMDDLKVTAHYQSHPQKELLAGSYTTNATAINKNIPGNKVLIISYTEGTVTKTAVITITVNQKADTAPQVEKGTKIIDKDSAGTYKVTSTDSENPTIECTGTMDKKKKTITIPEYVTYQGVKYKVTSVKAKSFKGNKKLTTIKIASSITKIGDSAFEGCTSLKTVTIGKGLKTIGKNAFKNCKKLKTLIVKSTKLKAVGKNAFKEINENCKIKVPSSKVKAYKKLMKNKGQKATVKITK